MNPDLWALYALMQRSRLYETAVAVLWEDGLISGEMHLGTGEEAIIAGIVSQLKPGDALALDHRATAALLMRGVDPLALLLEMLGSPQGLCRGQGGHMHLFSREHLAASSGIVGASGPAAAGFGLAAQVLRPGTLAVAFFGEAAMNQGMLMEAINLAAVWHLPVLFVCKDDGWAITSRPEAAFVGPLRDRVTGLGAEYLRVDGLDLFDVWQTAGAAMQSIRSGGGPVFLHAHCIHLEGHFLGMPLLRMIRRPLKEIPGIAIGLLRAFFRPGGASLSVRVAGIKQVLGALAATWRDPRRTASYDPVSRLRAALAYDPVRLEQLDDAISTEVAAVVAAARLEVGQ
jgi:pyruvate dehydrogenase E1 component alpha subunit